MGTSATTVCSWKALQREGIGEKAYRRWVEPRRALPGHRHLQNLPFPGSCNISAPFRLQLIQDVHKHMGCSLPAPASCENFWHLFEVYQNQRKSLQRWDTRTTSRSAGDYPRALCETIDKHYLKPPATDIAPHSTLYSQLCSNIIVDLVSISSQPGFIAST